MKNIALYLVRNDENLERTKSTLSLLANHEHLIHLLQGNWHQKKKKQRGNLKLYGLLLDQGVVS
jgi:hypothetical protein